MLGRLLLCVLLLSSILAERCLAEVVIETVTVGNPGNVGELSGEGAGGVGPDAIVGGVDYVYEIGKHEVTAGQYVVFLNAVAAEDPNELYDPWMWTEPAGCKIQRTGDPDSYSYTVAPERADRPVNYVSWLDAARFANWMHNGQPTGPQDLTTTEDGSYLLTDDYAYAWTRQPDATWVLPSEDEWYKAAYHYNDGVTSNYWMYPTASDETPSNLLVDPDAGNNANYYTNQFTIGGPYYRTEGGEFENSASPYGTFDQGGNVWEWNETLILDGYDANRGLRGGSYNDTAWGLEARFRYHYPLYGHLSVGFRVGLVPSLCATLDADANGTLDLADFAVFQNGDVELARYAILQSCLTGPDE